MFIMTENNNQSKETGLIHIYTGTGKGKTTAAIGLAARALGGRLSVCYCSFHKCPEKYGYSEMESLNKLGARVINFAQHHPHMDENVTDATIAEIKEEVSQAIETLTTLLSEEDFDILIMDEIFISIRDNYLDEDILIVYKEQTRQNGACTNGQRCNRQNNGNGSLHYGYGVRKASLL